MADANGSIVETTKYDRLSARRKRNVKKILCLGVSGIREGWACGTVDLSLIVERLDAPLPVVKSSRRNNVPLHIQTGRNQSTRLLVFVEGNPPSLERLRIHSLLGSNKSRFKPYRTSARREPKVDKKEKRTAIAGQMHCSFSGQAVHHNTRRRGSESAFQ